MTYKTCPQCGEIEFDISEKCSSCGYIFPKKSKRKAKRKLIKKLRKIQFILKIGCILFVLLACFFGIKAVLATSSQEFKDAARSYSLNVTLYDKWVDTYNQLVGIWNVSKDLGIGATPPNKELQEVTREMKKLELEMNPLKAILEPAIRLRTLYRNLAMVSLLLCIISLAVIFYISRKGKGSLTNNSAPKKETLPSKDAPLREKSAPVNLNYHSGG